MDWLDVFVPAFVTFLVIIDPPGCAVIFAGLTRDTSGQHRRAMAWRACLVAAVILVGFAFGGRPFLGALGISLDAFRIAGGLLLFLIALEMVTEKRTERRTSRADKMAQDAKAQHHDMEQEDISVFPMALPMIAGPGCIASVMLLMAKTGGDRVEQGAVLGALAAVLALTYVSLLLAGPLMRLMGATFSAMLTRLLGVILAALATQFVVDGVQAAFKL